MSPEAIILLSNAVLLGFAYLWAYPSLPKITSQAIAWRDVVISLAAILLAGALFAGSGIRFNLVLFETNWFVFALLTMMAMETPLFFWFAKKHNLRFDAWGDDWDDDPP